MVAFEPMTSSLLTIRAPLHHAIDSGYIASLTTVVEFIFDPGIIDLTRSRHSKASLGTNLARLDFTSDKIYFTSGKMYLTGDWQNIIYIESY